MEWEKLSVDEKLNALREVVSSHNNFIQDYLPILQENINVIIASATSVNRSMDKLSRVLNRRPRKWWKRG